MENNQIIIRPDPMTQEMSLTSFITLGVAFLFIFFAFRDMPTAGFAISLVLLGLLLLLIIGYLQGMRTIILFDGGCIFKLGSYQRCYQTKDLIAVICNNNRSSTTGDALDGPGVIISAKPIPSTIPSDARSYCLLHAPLTSVFIRFSQVDDDQKITYHKGGFSSKGHTADKEEIIRWLLENNILFHQC